MIRDKIKQETIESMKSKNEAKTSVLRMMSAAIKDKDIAARPKGQMDGITDDEILSLLQSMIKQRAESVEMYEQGGRADLVAKEKAEIEVISSYLPVQMNDAEIKEIVAQTIEKQGAVSIKDMGKVMGAMRGEYAGQMDFAKASIFIKEALQ